MKITTKFNLAIALLAFMPALLQAQFKNSLLQNHFARAKNVRNTNAATMAKTTILHEHGKSQDFSWNSSSNQWDWSSNTYIKYDGAGRQIWTASLGDTVKGQIDTSTYKIVTSYDANGSVFNLYYANTGDSILLLSSADTTLLDKKGVIIKYVSWDYNNNVWTLSSGNIDMTTYDINGNLVAYLEKDYDPGTATFKNSWYDIYSINADGSLKSDTAKSWNSANWVNNNLTDSVSWNAWNGNTNNSQVNSLVTKLWNSSSNIWQDDSKTFRTFYANGGMLETDQVFQGGWVNSDHYYYLVDSHGNDSAHNHESWISSTWVQDYSYIWNYTFDNQGNTTIDIEQQYDYSLQSYVNTVKHIYSNFNVISGLQAAKQSNNLFSIYPNPASDNIHLQAILPENERANISIYNMQGQLLQNGQFTGNELSNGVKMQINSLQPGIYLMRATTGNQEISKKFIKE